MPFNVNVRLLLTLLDVPALRPTWRAAIDAYRVEVQEKNSDMPEYTSDLYKVAVCMDATDSSSAQEEHSAELSEWLDVDWAHYDPVFLDE